MSEYYFYEAKQGDRWDIIANKFLGDMYKMNLIIAENPHVPITDTIEEGTILRIPKIEKEETTSGLPIWKQQNQ